ncbi:helix-turn-helix transcriptional regulator [Acinetobacter larvae]|uniref:Transcriptional regulator n=1 Tax=Acinetobacter larvae TaxID=1789224 RepID=A0A1B2LYL2_9GAMM|nr:helix-turn-helix transcriptional regulator [Acinetobacter larvae]AOA58030.1 transcriptional regulator [Acinetobacter larvae]
MKNIIAALRAERGWSQQHLAERLDVSRQTINAIEKQRYDPSLPLAFKLSKAFALSIHDIFQADDVE